MEGRFGACESLKDKVKYCEMVLLVAVGELDVGKRGKKCGNVAGKVYSPPGTLSKSEVRRLAFYGEFGFDGIQTARFELRV